MVKQIRCPTCTKAYHAQGRKTIGSHFSNYHTIQNTILRQTDNEEIGGCRRNTDGFLECYLLDCSFTVQHNSQMKKHLIGHNLGDIAYQVTSPNLKPANHNMWLREPQFLQQNHLNLSHFRPQPLLTNHRSPPASTITRLSLDTNSSSRDSPSLSSNISRPEIPSANLSTSPAPPASRPKRAATEDKDLVSIHSSLVLSKEVFE